MTLIDPPTRPTPTRKARRIRILRNVRQLRNHPREFFAAIGRQIPRGEIGVIRLGPVRALLVTRPEHARQVFVDQKDRYGRYGMMWTPLTALNGDGLAGEGPLHARSRALIAPLFGPARIARITEHMSTAVDQAVTELGARAGGGVVRGEREVRRIAYRALLRAFFGDRISIEDADDLGDAIADAFAALNSRMLMPFVPRGVPMPGDRRFARAVAMVDRIMYPLVDAAMAAAAAAPPAGPNSATTFEGGDIITWLAADNHQLDVPLSRKEIRDNLTTLFVGGSETTAVALAWLLITLEGHPEVAARIGEEVRRVVGTDVPEARHLESLTYTKQAYREILRVYPGGWVLPRTAVEHDTLGGVAVEPGDTIIMSQWLGHRIEDVWPDAETFDPERWNPDNEAESTRRLLTFGGGAHLCLGRFLTVAEAQLILARIYRDYVPTVTNAATVELRGEISIRPGRIDLVLTPRP
ncbi:cytochrome P450 [Longispora urticae]